VTSGYEHHAAAPDLAALELAPWLASSLLAQGLSTRAGEGLVETSPAGDGQNLVISLCPPQGSRARFTAPAVRVACFLEATYRLVAPGAEPVRTDLDAGIAGILAWGAS